MEEWILCFQYYVEAFLLPIVTMLGLLGNLIFIAIFSIHRGKNITFHRWTTNLILCNIFVFSCQINDLFCLLWLFVSHKLGHHLLHPPLGAAPGHHLYIQQVNHSLVAFVTNESHRSISILVYILCTKGSYPEIHDNNRNLKYEIRMTFEIWHKNWFERDWFQNCIYWFFCFLLWLVWSK